MVRFSCFQGHVNYHKQKRTGQLSAEAMQKTTEDASGSRDLSNFSTETKPRVRGEGDTLNGSVDQVTDSSFTERDCRSDEIESKYNTNHDIAVHKKSQIRKSLSLGSGLNRKGRTSDVGSEDEMEKKNSSDESVDHSETLGPDTNDNLHGFNPADQYQEPVPSDSVQVHFDFAKDESIFSIGDPVEEKECADEDDINSHGGRVSDDHTPRTPPCIVKSCSLPSMTSPKRISTSFFPCSRSSEDLNALDSRKKGILHGVGRPVQVQKGDDSNSNDEKNNAENIADDSFETYNYVASAKDWIVPESDGTNRMRSMKGKTSLQNWDEGPSKNMRLKRIEDWVSDLQHCSSLEESEITSSGDRELLKGKESLEEPTAAKPDVKINPGTEAAKRYISSLNASATAAQLTNLGLVVIPFLSAFVSLKALNISGNAIARITAGALPRGLHILNLSKNNISTIEGLRDLTRLRVLDLSYNRILRIGHGLAGCSSLKELYLAGNKISEVEGLHRLLKLNVLDLRFNKISTTKCLGQLASNYNCLQALSLEGNPAQKNVGDEQLKKYVLSLLPNLTYYNRKSIKVGTMKDTADRSTRLGIGAHQIDRGLRVEAKSSRKGTHGIVAQKVSSSSSIHGRKTQVVSSQKTSRSRNAHLPPTGTKGHQVADLGSRIMSLRNDFSIRRSRSEGTLGAL